MKRKKEKKRKKERKKSSQERREEKSPPLIAIYSFFPSFLYPLLLYKLTPEAQKETETQRERDAHTEMPEEGKSSSSSSSSGSNKKREEIVADVGAWAMNITSSVGIIMANKQVMSPKGYDFRFGISSAHLIPSLVASI